MKEIPLGASGRTAKELAREAALSAGSLLIERFNGPKKVSSKGRGNIVTDVDMAAETVVMSILKAEFPNMGFLGEESEGAKADIGYVWIVDPLDGTRNYASGIPVFSVVVGLALDGEVLIGVNYDPVREEMFEAIKGAGAYLNGDPIRVSDRTSISEGIVGMDLSYNNEGAGNGLDVIRSIWPEMQTARIMGSSALGLSYVAAGRTDLYFNHQLAPWDQVAGLLLVEEAGGLITDRVGKRASLYSDGLCAANSAIHTEFMRKTDGMPWRTPSRRIV